jgi:DNA-binding MarR family transcriptional regulator
VLLFQRAPQSLHSRTDLARALYIDESRAADLLNALSGAGIVAASTDPEPRYHYAPGDPELAAAIERLARVYDIEMVAITHLIHAATGKSAHRFADAFKLRKDR